ncbi:MAG: hypothetical protein ABIK83_04240 [Candidatus Zixiibacteriota bacterium]
MHRDLSTDSLIVTSYYDSDEFKSKVSERLALGYGGEEAQDYWWGDIDFRVNRFKLLTSTTFGESTDFVLLSYYLDTLSLYSEGRLITIKRSSFGPVFVGYEKDSKQTYVYADRMGKAFDSVFNSMQSEADDVRDLPLVCKAALLLQLKYRVGRTVIVDSWSDVEAWGAISGSLASLPPKWDQENRVFVFFPSKDIALMNATAEARRDRIKFMSKVDRWVEDFARAKDSVQLEAPKVIAGDDSVTVIISAYSYVTNGEVATWKVVFSKSGILRYIGYNELPSYYHYENFDIGLGGH